MEYIVIAISKLQKRCSDFIKLALLSKKGLQIPHLHGFSIVL